MKILHESVAGTLESSDVMVSVVPHGGGIELEIHSTVGQQFFAQIEETVRAVLRDLGVESVMLRLEDKGALDCVLQARIKAALLRASDEAPQWEVLL